jgi:hypothetical protein
MEKIEFSKGLGEAIIKKQHGYFTDVGEEDLNHITNLKRIIVAISDYLKSDGLKKDDIDCVVDNLHHLSKTLYLESCLPNKEAYQDEQEFMAESETWFDYLYKYGKYPE